MSQVSEIIVNWTPETSGRVSTIQIQSRIVGTSQWTEQAAAVDASLGEFRFGSNAPATDVEVRTRFRMVSGVFGAWSTDHIVTAPVTVNYVDLTGTPSKLSDINTTEGGKLTGIASGADVTRDNTSRDTAAVNGTPAGTVITNINTANTNADKAVAALTNPNDPTKVYKVSEIVTDVSGLKATYGSTASAASSANQANVAKNAAEAARDIAKAAQSVTETARDQAGTARDQAGNANTQAQQQANDARISAGNASGFASTASGKADIATQKASDASQSAIIAQGYSSTAQTKAGEASTSASNAAQSESNALGSKNSAASSASVAASTLTKTIETVGNENFDSGMTGWSNPGNMFVRASAAGRSNVAETTPGEYRVIEGRKVQINNPTQRFRISAGFRAAAGGNCTNYLGAAFYDGNNDYVGASDGTGNYPLGPGFNLNSTVDSGWKDRSVIIGKGSVPASPYGGTTVIPANAVYMRPIAFLNYVNGSTDAVLQLDYFRIEDATGEFYANQAASAAAISASNASASESNAGQSASAALTSETNARTKAGEASTSASQASLSESNALGSKNAAATSAQVSATSADTATKTALNQHPTTFEQGATFFAGDAGDAAPNGIFEPVSGVPCIRNADANGYGVIAWKSCVATSQGYWKVRAKVGNAGGPASGVQLRLSSFNNQVPPQSRIAIFSEQDRQVPGDGFVWVEATYDLRSVDVNSHPFIKPEIVIHYGSYAGGSTFVRCAALELVNVTAQEEAKKSATAAALSASNASASESNAGQSASAALGSETNARTKAGEASTSAANASTSETNALGSKNAAAISAGVAASSAQDAGGAATADNRNPGASPSLWEFNDWTTLNTTNTVATYAKDRPDLANIVNGRLQVRNNGQAHTGPIRAVPIIQGRRYRARFVARAIVAGDSLEAVIPCWDRSGNWLGYTYHAIGALQSTDTVMQFTISTVPGRADVTFLNGNENTPNIAYARPVIILRGTNGAVSEGIEASLIDVESELAASGSASAAAGSASTAQTKADAAGQSAEAANTSKVQAEAANQGAKGYAETARTDAATATAKASEASSAATLAARYQSGGNLSPNSSLSTLDGYSITNNTGATQLSQNRAGEYWQIGGVENNFAIFSTPSFSGYAEVYGPPFAVAAGGSIQFYVYTASHRCRGWATVFFFDGGNNFVGYAGEFYAPRQSNGGRSINDWDQIGAPDIGVPGNAVRARIVFRSYDGTGDSYSWFSRPYVAVSRPGLTQFNAYSASNDRPVNDETLARIGREESARATADSAAATRITNLQATAATGTDAININPNFAWWDEGRNVPNGWTAWVYEGQTNRVAAPAFRGGLEAQMIVGAGPSHGIYIPGTELPNGWYVFEMEGYLVSGGWRSAGITLSGVHNPIDCARTADINGVISENQTGNRKWKVLYKVTAGIASYNFHLMHSWTGFGLPMDAKTIHWKRCSARAASDVEIAAGTVLPDTTARVKVSEAAIASIQGQSTAVWQTEVNAGSAGAFATMKAVSNNPAVAELTWGNTSNVAISTDKRTITGINGQGWGGSGAWSSQTYTGDVTASFTPTAGSASVFVGLSSNPGNQGFSYPVVDFSWHLSVDGNCYVFYSSSLILNYAPRSAVWGHTLKVVRSGGTIIWYDGNKEVYRRDAGGGNLWLGTVYNPSESGGNAKATNLIFGPGVETSTSNVGIGANEVAIFNPVSGGYVKTVSFTNGGAVFTGGIAASSYTLLTNGQKWRFQFAPQAFPASDGQGISFPNFGALPVVEFGPCPVPLNTGEVYTPYAESLSNTGFTARLIIQVPGQSSSYSVNGDEGSGGGPTRQRSLDGNPQSADGNYTLSYNGSASVFYSTYRNNYEPDDYDNVVSIAVDIYAYKGGWQKVATDYVDCTVSRGSARGTYTGYWSLQNTYQMGSGVTSVGIALNSYSGGSGAAVGNITNVSWTAQGSASFTRSATPSGQKVNVTVRPQ